MTDQPTDARRNLADLSMSDFLMLTMKLCEEQGYITSDGDLTPLGEGYLAALLQEQAEQMAVIEIPLPPPHIAPNNAAGDASGGMEWSDLPDF